jgi:hypothetical protein
MSPRAVLCCNMPSSAATCRLLLQHAVFCRNQTRGRRRPAQLSGALGRHRTLQVNAPMLGRRASNALPRRGEAQRLPVAFFQELLHSTQHSHAAWQQLHTFARRVRACETGKPHSGACTWPGLPPGHIHSSSGAVSSPAQENACEGSAHLPLPRQPCGLSLEDCSLHRPSSVGSRECHWHPPASWRCTVTHRKHGEQLQRSSRAPPASRSAPRSSVLCD